MKGHKRGPCFCTGFCESLSAKQFEVRGGRGGQSAVTAPGTELFLPCQAGKADSCGQWVRENELSSGHQALGGSLPSSLWKVAFCFCLSLLAFPGTSCLFLAPLGDGLSSYGTHVKDRGRQASLQRPALPITRLPSWACLPGQNKTLDHNHSCQHQSYSLWLLSVAKTQGTMTTRACDRSLVWSWRPQLSVGLLSCGTCPEIGTQSFLIWLNDVSIHP